MGYTVRLDKDVCISSGKCVDAAPEAFRFDDDALAEPVDGALSDERLLETARNCPSGAIELYDGETQVDIF
ncbi:MAG: ferredoxin [Pseudonocardiaceae bacterium]|nr:ferredoxin [Pseudonocardiaceae bacterium]